MLILRNNKNISKQKKVFIQCYTIYNVNKANKFIRMFRIIENTSWNVRIKPSLIGLVTNTAFSTRTFCMT